MLEGELGLRLHPEKTRIVHITRGFEFLGYKIGRGKGMTPQGWRSEPLRGPDRPLDRALQGQGARGDQPAQPQDP